MVTVGIILINTTDLLFTEYKYKHQLNRFASNEKYTEYQNQNNPSNKEQWRLISTELLEEKRIVARVDYIEEIKDGAISSIINSATWFMTGLIFFLIHWRMYKGLSSNISE